MQGIPESARRGVEPVANPLSGDHTHTTRHGAFSERPVGPLAAEILESEEELVEGSPAAYPTFAAARGVSARKLARLRDLSPRGGVPLRLVLQPVGVAQQTSYTGL